MIKSRFACSTNGAMRNAYKILVAKPEYSEDLGVEGRII
jgi:hypothetical protein